MQQQSTITPKPDDEAAATRAPGPHLIALEGRALLEYSATIALWPVLCNAPRGDGHPVLVFPGLAAPDASTLLLRRYLQAQGYAPHRWKLGFNLGPRAGVLAACLRRIAELRARYDRKVSLIGWSLGGVYARELAKLAEDDVRLVITLGTPFTGDLKASNAWRLYEFTSGERIGASPLHRHLDQTPPVPTTSIYTRSDGVVAWQCSVQQESPLAENIEVRASPIGLGVNASVFNAIGDRLAQPEGAWKAFEPNGLWRIAYPDARRPS